VITRSSLVPGRRILTVSDAEGYRKRGDDDQRDLQTWMAEIEKQAAINARLDRQRAFIQNKGDGDLTAWPPGASELDLVVDYPRELRRELDRVNGTLSKDSRIRIRLAITSGLVEAAAQGITGQAAIRATTLADSDELRQALRKAGRHPLVVILDNSMFEDVVKTGRRGLEQEMYKKVFVKDKNGSVHTAWITIPGASQRTIAKLFSDSSTPGDDPPRGSRSVAGPKKRTPGWTLSITVALIGAAGAIAASIITSMSSGNSGDPKIPGTAPSTSTISPSAGTASSPGRPTGKLYAEVTDNHLGTDVFRDPMGDAVTSGPSSIPFGTHVMVKCWASNESGMGSINAFYLIETSPWSGEYAPANTFLNGDTSSSLDPKVPECTAT
jgi:hypothetical protein